MPSGLCAPLGRHTQRTCTIQSHIQIHTRHKSPEHKAMENSTYSKDMVRRDSSPRTEKKKKDHLLKFILLYIDLKQEPVPRTSLHCTQNKRKGRLVLVDSCSGLPPVLQSFPMHALTLSPLTLKWSQ